jgi:Carbohydrate family 9 binding domain-like
MFNYNLQGKIMFISKWTASIILLFSITGNSYANMKSLAFYTVNHSADSPAVDGKLNDGCWSNAAVYSTYYVYYKPNPKRGKLKSELRMLWNERGLYVGITNFDDNMKAIRAKHTTRDNSDLWTDDCAELYFDSDANGVGFTKFIVNALGTVTDMRRIDAAVTLPGWSASGTQVATSQTKNAWYIEAFFPWNDLGKKPDANTVWRFCHVRYAWSSGKFVGVTSSPGGSYTSPGNFGFIYFAKGNTPGVKEIASLLKSRANPPWSLSINQGLLICDDGNPEFSKLTELYAKKYATAQKLLRQAEQLDKKQHKQLKALKQQFTKLTTPNGSEDDLERLKQLVELTGKLNNVYWKLKLNKLLKN